MKKILVLFLLLIINIHSLAEADDIRDFQIEGMSIGDSALDFFSKDEIKKALNKKLTYPGSKKFFQIDPFKKHETYENVSFSIKKGDKKYVIYQIKGMLAYANKLDECLKKKEIILKDISSILVNAEEDKYEDEFGGKIGKSIAYITDLNLSDGSIRVWCVAWDRKHEISEHWTDTLNVDVSSKKYLNWLNNEAYN